MIIRILVKIGEKILGMGVKDDEPRADMFLPDWLLAFGMVLIVGGLGFGIFAAVTFNIIMLAIAVCALLLGVVAVMCWKNQTIRVISQEKFEYTTFLGHTKSFRFDEIRGLKQNSDSMTLYVGNDKVHIETCAVFTDRLADLLDQALDSLEAEEEQ